MKSVCVSSTTFTCLSFATAGYSGLRWATVGYGGLRRATVGYSGRKDHTVIEKTETMGNQPRTGKTHNVTLFTRMIKQRDRRSVSHDELLHTPGCVFTCIINTSPLPSPMNTSWLVFLKNAYCRGSSTCLKAQGWPHWYALSPSIFHSLVPLLFRCPEFENAVLVFHSLVPLLFLCPEFETVCLSFIALFPLLFRCPELETVCLCCRRRLRIKTSTQKSVSSAPVEG